MSNKNFMLELFYLAVYISMKISERCKCSLAIFFGCYLFNIIFGKFTSQCQFQNAVFISRLIFGLEKPGQKTTQILTEVWRQNLF